MRKAFIILLLLLTACTPSTEQTEEGLLSLEPCHLDGGLAAQCGVLTVPENRDVGNGRTIDLHIAVLPATSSITEADPLFMLAGGPGQAAISTYTLASSLLEDLNEARDIVLVDQRGTGEFSPLTCASLEEAPDVVRSSSEIVQLYQECARQIAETIDLTQYTTDIAMTDIDEVREALGYEQINLYGASYGTRAALTYLRLFPEHVRSLVLDSVVGPDLVLFEQMPRDGQRALEMLFARCAADVACQMNFPDLIDDYAGLLAKLERPREMIVPHPLNSADIELTLTRDLFATYMFNTLYSTDLVALLPLLIHEANATDDFEPLVSMAQTYLVSGSTGLNTVLLYSVTCAEDAPLIDLAEAEALHAATDFGFWAGDFLEICAAWPETAVASDFRQLPPNDVPTLILSGDADPVTPPSYADQVIDALPQNVQLIVPHYGHGLLTVGCMPEVVTTFIEAGSAEELDTTCLDKVQPLPFFVDFAGPEA